MNSTREKTLKKVVRFHQEKTNPSFSSTLLDEIYRSIDESDDKNGNLDLSFGDLKVKKKQSNNGDFKSNKTLDHQQEKVNEQMVPNKPQVSPEFDRKSRYLYNDGVCFSSSSCSSDSSSGGFSISSSETELNLNPQPNPKTKTIRTKQSNKKTEQQHHQHNFEEKDGILKLKSSAMKIYSNLKKVNQPISPGARLSAFINSLFTSSNGHNHDKKKKSKSSQSIQNSDQIDKLGSVKATPMCSSATLFSRSCLSKNTSCTLREDSRKSVEAVKSQPVNVVSDKKSIEGVKSRPVNVISDKKTAHRSNADHNPAAVSVKSTNLSKIRTEKEHRFQMVAKSRKTEQAALRQYIEAKHKMKISANNRDFSANYKINTIPDDNDYASDSSSDLFELDHLTFNRKNHLYCEELPVYATTRVITNRAIR